MHRGFLTTAIIFGMLSVILGAFAAHQLRETVSDYAVEIFETGVRYQFYHAFALLAAGILYKEFPGKWIKAAGWFFISGIILFSGSLYALMYVKAAVLPGYKWLGPITPAGGLLLILGWLCLLIAIVRKGNGNRHN